MPPNVLLVIVDSLRARNLPLYGHVEHTAPFLSAFAEEATVYTQARSPSTWSLPSHVSIFTGRDVAEHGIGSREQTLGPGYTIWEHLRDEYGYATGIFSDNPFVTSETYGLQRGFETVRTGLPRNDFPFAGGLTPEAFARSGGGSPVEYVARSLGSARPLASLGNGLVGKVHNAAPSLLPDRLRPRRRNSGLRYAMAFLDWEREQSSNWAACLNLVDVHHPYVPREEYNRWGDAQLRGVHDSIDHHTWDFYSGRRGWWQRRALEALYDGCIREADDVVRRIVTGLRDRDALDETLVVITSDHGEGFGEPSRIRPGHRIAGNEAGIHERQLHVPLLVSHPGQTDGARSDRLATLTSFHEVTRETVAEGGRPSFESDGEILCSVDVDQKYEGYVEGFAAYEDEIDTNAFTGVAHAVYRHTGDGVEKFVEWGEHEAHVRVRNAQEAMTIESDAGDHVSDYLDHLDSHPIGERAGRELGARTQSQLEELGYM